MREKFFSFIFKYNTNKIYLLHIHVSSKSDHIVTFRGMKSSSFARQCYIVTNGVSYVRDCSFICFFSQHWNFCFPKVIKKVSITFEFPAIWEKQAQLRHGKAGSRKGSRVNIVKSVLGWLGRPVSSHRYVMPLSIYLYI